MQNSDFYSDMNELTKNHLMRRHEEERQRAAFLNNYMNPLSASSDDDSGSDSNSYVPDPYIHARPAYLPEHQPWTPPLAKIDPIPELPLYQPPVQPKKYVDTDLLSKNQHWMLPNELAKPEPMLSHSFQPADFGPKRPIIEPLDRFPRPLSGCTAPLSQPSPITIRPVQSAW